MAEPFGRYLGPPVSRQFDVASHPVSIRSLSLIYIFFQDLNPLEVMFGNRPVVFRTGQKNGMEVFLEPHEANSHPWQDRPDGSPVLPLDKLLFFHWFMQFYGIAYFAGSWPGLPVLPVHDEDRDVPPQNGKGWTL